MPQAMERARRVKLMAFDVDGVLTDGRLYFGSAGDEMKAFSSRDGHGMKMLQSSGVVLAIITGRSSLAVERRAQNLGIELLRQGVIDKRAALIEMTSALGIAPVEAGYMGDDVVDLQVLRTCGFAATVADSHALVLQHAHYVAREPAGLGAVREVCEFVLRAQGNLDALLKRYLD